MSKKELKSLSQEARKYKSAKEFGNAIIKRAENALNRYVRLDNNLFDRGLTTTKKIGKHPEMKIAIKEFKEAHDILDNFRVARRISTKRITDFYNQAIYKVRR